MVQRTYTAVAGRRGAGTERRTLSLAPTRTHRMGEAPPTEPVFMSAVGPAGLGHKVAWVWVTGGAPAPAAGSPVHRKLRSTGAPGSARSPRAGGSGQLLGEWREVGPPGDPPERPWTHGAPAAKTWGGGEGISHGTLQPRIRGHRADRLPQPAQRPFSPDLKHNPAAGLLATLLESEGFYLRVGLWVGPPAGCPCGSLGTVTDRFAWSVPEPSIKRCFLQTQGWLSRSYGQLHSPGLVAPPSCPTAS